MSTFKISVEICTGFWTVSGVRLKKNLKISKSFHLNRTLRTPHTRSDRHRKGRKVSFEPSCNPRCSCHQWFAVGGASIHFVKEAGTLPDSHHLSTAGNNLAFPTLWSLSFAVMHLFCSLSLFSSFAVGAPPTALPPPPCQHHDILGLCGILTFCSCWEINYVSTFEMMV